MRRWGIIILGIICISGLFGCDAPESEEKLPDFKAVDLENNYVTNEVFSHSELTMINIWATYCAPCINEMPDIQRLQEDLLDKNVQVIGIVADKRLSTAQKITADQEVSYVNLLPDRSLSDNLISRFDYVPVTVFVDSEGRLLDTIISGSRDYDTYMKIIEELLESQQP